MSVRVLVLLIGVMAAGSVDALAVNAPLLGDNPREDLFASKPASPAPAASPAPVPPAAGPASPRAAPAAERVVTGNPLWAIPLSGLTAGRDRPLFAPLRRPPAVAAAAKPAPAPFAPPPKPPEPEKPPLALLGTIAGSTTAAGLGLFMDPASKAMLRLKAGENHQGWILRAVRARQVELAKGLDSAVLDLPPPDMKAAAGPAPPVHAPLPVNTAKATGAMPASAPANATIVVQQPVFKPPPAPVNPFQNINPFQNKRLP